MQYTLKHEIQLYKVPVLLSLKVVKFDTKMYLNFSNFWGRNSAGGTSPGPKTGTSVGWGGLTKFLPDGGPPVIPGKNPGLAIVKLGSFPTSLMFCFLFTNANVSCDL